MWNRMAPMSLRTLTLIGIAAGGCATATPQTVEADQRKENETFRDDQRKDGAAFDRRQQDERSKHVADQEQARVDVVMSNEADQKTFAIDARERVARLDSRIVELRALGKQISPEIIEARNAVLRHINTSAAEVVSHAAWMRERDAVNAELSALTKQIERASG